MGSTVLLAGGVRESTSLLLTAGLDENWRGAYDLLVTTSPESLNRCTDADGNARVAANFASGGDGGLDMEDVRAMRSVDGVEVAAPIGLVGEYTGTAPTVDLVVPDDIAENSGWSGYDVRARVRADTGAGEADLGSNHARVLIGREPENRSGNLIEAPGEFFSLEVAGLPAMTQHIVAVDPVAERELLGEGSEFLQPLIYTAEGTRDYFDLDWDREKVTVPLNPLTPPPEASDQAPDSPPTQAIPVVINVDPQFKVEVHLDVARLDTSSMPAGGTEGMDDVAAGLALGEKFSPHTATFTTELRPFSSAMLNVPAWWTQVAESNTWGGNYLSLNRAVPGPLALNASGCDLEAITTGPVRISSPANRGGGYEEQTYRTVSSIEMDGPLPIPIVIGEYSSSAIDRQVDQASYVPLGAYEPGETYIVEPERAYVPPGTVLRPAFSGRGLTVASAAGITDMRGAQALIGREAVDAVRVRVSGLSGYDAQGRQRVADVAQELAAMGYHVDVVAGSSREATRIDVPGFYVEGSDPDNAGALGTVEQQWSTLGAAGRVQHSMDRVGQVLLFLATGMAALTWVAVAALGGRERRAEAAVHRTIGWTRGDSARWFGAEVVVGFLVLLALVLPSLWVFRTSPVFLGVLATALCAFLVGAGLFLWQTLTATAAPRGARRPGRAAQRGARPMSLLSLVLKRLTADLPTTILLALALGGVGAAGAGCVLAIMEAREAAGATMLSDLLSSTLLPLHLGLAGLGVLSSLVLAVTSRRIELRSARLTQAALRVSGWSPRDLTQLWLLHTAAVGLAALLLATVLTTVVVHSTTSPAVIVPIAAAITLLTVVGLLLGQLHRPQPKGT